MPRAARPRSPRLLVLAAVTAALAPVLVAGPAAAEDPAVPGEVTAGDTVTGELVQAWAEHADPEHAAEHADDALVSWVTEDDGTSVRVHTADVEDVPVGATVEVTLGAELPAEPGTPPGAEPVHEVVDAAVVAPAPPAPVAPASAPYTNEVTVVLVDPRDQSPDATTVQQVVDQVNGPVADFWETQSNGAVRIHATAGRTTWVTSDAACGFSSALWDDVAGQIGWVDGPGRHLLLYVPGYRGDPNDPCSYGLAEIGSSPADGGKLYVRGVETSVIAHELGHNFGLGHASLLQCDGSVEGSRCQTEPYWDWYDVMGISWNEVGSLNAPHAARLGFLPSSAQRVLTSTGAGSTVTLAPQGSRSGVRVLALTAGSTRYWLEHRAAVGQDAWLDPTIGYGFDTGVLLHVDGPGPRSDTSLLLDGTPSVEEDWFTDEQQVLPVGREVVLSGGFRLTVTSAGRESATVTVRTPADGTPSPITELHERLGGAAGRLGAAIALERCGLRDGGCLRHFQHGSIYWSPATGAHVVDGDIRTRWGQLGWENGGYGYPVAGAWCGLRDGGCLQHFQRGSIYWTPATGAVAIDGDIRSRWGQLGWELGRYGYPVANARCGLRDGGCLQLFQGGSIYWTPFTGARAVDGDIRARWGQLGWELGYYGYPTSDAVCSRDAVCAQDFQGGSIFWTPSSGARAVDGAIRDRWGRLGALGGRYGHPVSDARCGLRDGGCLQQFRGGWIYWSPATGARAIDGDIRTRWGQLGWEMGPYGYPITDARCGLVGGACVQEFQGGTIYWTPAYGARAMDGAIRARWWPSMGSGTNYPVSDARCGLRNGGCLQQFEQTTIYWSPATGAHPVHGVIRDRWAAQGWENGRLGYPVHNETCELYSGGCVRLVQRFQGGTITVP